MRVRRNTQRLAASDNPESPPGRLIAYARISTPDQNLKMQIDSFAAAGVHPDNIHQDIISGSTSKRPGLDLALKDCVPGDTLVVYKMDRLGRDVLHLLTLINALEKRGVGFRSLTEGFDTSTTTGRVMMQFIAIMAEFERSRIRERTGDGIRSQAAAGKKFGAKQKINTDVAEKMFRDGASIKDVCERFKLRSRSTVYSYFKSAEIEDMREKGKEARKRAARRKR